MSRYLVTTADSHGWPMPGEEAVVLWRSCVPDNNGSVEQPPPPVAAPFYPDVQRRLALGLEERRIYEQVLPALASGLNAYHGTAHSPRQWEIMVGPFLVRYIRIVVNRYLKLDHVLATDGVDRSVHVSWGEEVVPHDTLHIIQLSEDDRWNHEICFWFLRDYFPAVSIETRDAADRRPAYAPLPGRDGDEGLVRRLVRGLRGRGRIYIQDLHASRSLKLRFYLLNGQLPMRANPFRPASPAVPTDRASLDLGPLLTDRSAPYDDAVARYLPRLLPKCFVESFDEYRKHVARTAPPERPRTIVTSTSFDADEPFKMWVAGEVGRGSRYVVLQHGAIYGVNPFFVDTVEERTSDEFVTWGWRQGPNHVPGFCLTTHRRRLKRAPSADRLGLVTLTQRRKKFLWDVEVEFDCYMDAQFRLVDALAPSVRDSLVIRLHAAHVRARGGLRERFESRYPDVPLDTGESPIWHAVQDYRLTVFTYDSTGVLELLSLNHPVVAFWNEDGFDQVGPQAQEYYALLKKAGILFHSPEALASFLSEHWDGIVEWWASGTVQEARRTFCAQYAASSKGGARHLRRLILEGATTAT